MDAGRAPPPPDVAAMDEEIKKIVQDSIDFAEQSPELPLEALMEDILVETTS
jgi:pyruvate dehydrogenase E1 component alpha subunit